MRAGASKGLFLRLEDLLAQREDWKLIIPAAMGSPDPYLKQLDGMGGGVNTQTKVTVVSRSNDPNVDVDYLCI
jgi:2-methylaconitate cis-trans-isomerase PrpF